MQTAEHLHRVAREFVEDLVEDGVMYAEVRWAPEQHLAGGLTLDQAVEAVQAGIDEGVANAEATGAPIRVGQLITAMRQNDRAMEIAELAVRHREAGAVGFDIAGPETGFPPARFAEAFTWLADEYFPATVHAGEVGRRGLIRDALFNGRALRLGHGVRIAEDITVEFDAQDENGERSARTPHSWTSARPRPGCGTARSPWRSARPRTCRPAPWHPRGDRLHHPIDMLYQLGFRVTINPDNRLMSGASLTDELDLLGEAFGYSLEELRTSSSTPPRRPSCRWRSARRSPNCSWRPGRGHLHRRHRRGPRDPGGVRR